MGRKKKEPEIKPLSMYEEDCIWMSYRYCIGRHTIASHMHAGNIATNAYHRLNIDRMEFMAKDILEEIHSKLNWMDVRSDFSVKYGNSEVILFEKLLEFYNEHCNDENFKKITGLYLRDNMTWDVTYKNDDESEIKCIFGTYRINDIRDLHVWYKLAKCFMKSKHAIYNSKNHGDIEYFNCYEEYRTEDGDEYIMRMIPLDRYLSNPSVTCWLDPEFDK